MVVIARPLPKAIIMDLAGTVIKTKFIDRVLMQYITNNVKEFIVGNWKNKEIRGMVDDLRMEAQRDPSAPKIANPSAPEPEIKQSVVVYMNYCTENKIHNNSVVKFRYHMWKIGYRQSKLNTSVYSDVSSQVHKWKRMNVKAYVLSNTWAEGAKTFLSYTNQGHLDNLFDGYFDSNEGPLHKKETFQKVLEKIELKANEVIYLTKWPKAAKAAMEAGIDAILVLTHRKNINKLTEKEKQMPRIRSFLELYLYEL